MATKHISQSIDSEQQYRSRNIQRQTESTDKALNSKEREELEIKALRYINAKGWGYISDFENKFGKETIDRFKKKGFIKSGFSGVSRLKRLLTKNNYLKNRENAETWKQTEMAKGELILLSVKSAY